MSNILVQNFFLQNIKGNFIEQKSSFDVVRFYHYMTKPKGNYTTIAVFKIKWK